MSYRLQDRALRDGAQGRRHGALPARARLAPRGPARRPELPELLRRAAGQQVRQGRALRSRRRRAVRRLPVALLPRGRQRRLRPLRREVLRVSGTGCSPNERASASSSGPTSGARSTTCGRSTSSASDVPDRHAASERPRTTSTTRSTSRRRRSCTACSSSRTSSRWRTGSRRACRSSTTTSSTSRSGCRSGSSCATSSHVVQLNENEPGQRRNVLRADARRQAAPAPCDGAPRPGTVTEQREAGLLRARRELVPRREHRLRPPTAARPASEDLRVSRPRAVRELVAEHLNGRATGGC